MVVFFVFFRTFWQLQMNNLSIYLSIYIYIYIYLYIYLYLSIYLSIYLYIYISISISISIYLSIYIYMQFIQYGKQSLPAALVYSFIDSFTFHVSTNICICLKHYLVALCWLNLWCYTTNICPAAIISFPF